MIPFARERRPQGDRPLWRHGTMARSRCVAGRPAVRVIVAGIGATLLLAHLVALANGVVNLRRQIDGLQSEKSYLEARYALRIAQWNRLSSREMIVARAEKELGLITPDGPGPVIVMTDGTTERPQSVWRRFLDAIGGGKGGVPAVAAQDKWP
jgi:cell division protein FtsB